MEAQAGLLLLFFCSFSFYLIIGLIVAIPMSDYEEDYMNNTLFWPFVILYRIIKSIIDLFRPSKDSDAFHGFGS